MISQWTCVLLVGCGMLLAPGCSDDEGPAGLGRVCEQGEQCESKRCEEGVCKAAEPKGPGEACGHPLQCRSESCQDNICSGGMRADGTDCLDDLQCQSGVCGGKICGGVPTDASPDGSEPDAGADSAPPVDADQPDTAPPDAAVDQPIPPDTSPPDTSPPPDLAPIDTASPDAGPTCGNSTCEVGESCDGRDGTISCPADCEAGNSPKYCYVNGICEGPGCP